VRRCNQRALGNTVSKFDISELASALKNLTLQLEPATGAGAAAVMKGSTEQTGTPAVVTGGMGKRALKGKSASLGDNNKGTNNDISSPNQQIESLMKHRSEANKKRSGMRTFKVSLLLRSVFLFFKKILLLHFHSL
jgi:hypothetical protein